MRVTVVIPTYRRPELLARWQADFLENAAKAFQGESGQRLPR